ncbi:MAG: DUF1684 domain-containing protein, partial [Deltaproteobacteria bacterium]|nr:DUF1684 domain-containing protein [Deltaproteobacteria bacterium]
YRLSVVRIPYCTYSANYVCPLMPRENSLDVEVFTAQKARLTVSLSRLTVSL